MFFKPVLCLTTPYHRTLEAGVESMPYTTSSQWLMLVAPGVFACCDSNDQTIASEDQYGAASAWPWLWCCNTRRKECKTP